MKKISINLIVTILGLVISALRGALSLAKKIGDLVDNGKADGSFACPPWLMNIEAGLEYVERGVNCLELASGFAAKDLSNTDE